MSGSSPSEQLNLLKPGRRRIPPSRAIVSDLLYFHQQIPTCAHDRVMQLSALESVRKGSIERISVAMLFTKAYSAVAARHPELQQTWRNWPVAHLYQHAEPVSLITVSRHFEDADWLFWGRLAAPHRQTLAALQKQLDRFTSQPVEHVFRRQLHLSALPVWIRRTLLWWTLNVAGGKRAQRTGTFTVTSISGRGAEIQHPPTIATSTLTYGPIARTGQCRVTLVYDHRVMDGALVARVLEELESELNGAIVEELLECTNRESSSMRVA